MAAGATDTSALNVGTGRETSLLELAAELALETEERPGRLGEVQRLASIDAAGRALGWTARTPLGRWHAGGARGRGASANPPFGGQDASLVDDRGMSTTSS